MKKFNVSKNNTLVVGDSDIDIKAGRAAGVKTVAVTYGYREKELLEDADFIIDRFSDLLSIVRKT
jgi:Predicted phosphatases